MGFDNQLQPGMTRISFINRTQETLIAPLLVKKENGHGWLNKVIVNNEPIGTFMSEFLNADFESLGATEDFIARFGFPCPCQAELEHLYTSDEVANLIQNVAENYILCGKSQIKLALDRILRFCWGLDVEEDINERSPLERYALLHNHKMDDFRILTVAYAERQVIKSQFATSSAVSDAVHVFDSINDILVDMTKKKTEVNPNYGEVYTAHTHLDICLTELEEMLIGNLPIRPCKNCGRWFTPIGRNDTEYCTRPIDSTTSKTCRTVGPHKSYEDKLRSDPASMIYRKSYRKLHQRLTATERYRITRAAFEGWKAAANQQMNLVKEGKITAEALEAWIKASEVKLLDKEE